MNYWLCIQYPVIGNPLLEAYSAMALPLLILLPKCFRYCWKVIINVFNLCPYPMQFFYTFFLLIWNDFISFLTAAFLFCLSSYSLCQNNVQETKGVSFLTTIFFPRCSIPFIKLNSTITALHFFFLGGGSLYLFPATIKDKKKDVGGLWHS